MRWTSSSAGSAARQRDRILAIARVEQLLLLRDADRDEIRQPQLLERRVGRRQLAFAAVDHDQVRKRPALLEHLAVSTQHDFVHGGEIVLDGDSGRDSGLGSRSQLRLNRPPPTPEAP